MRREVAIGLGGQVAMIARAERRDLQGDAPRILEAGQVATIHGGYLFRRRAQPPCQGGMRGESIFATVDLRDTHREQLFQQDRHLAVSHHRAHVLRQSARDLRPMLAEALAAAGPSIIDAPVDYRENARLTARLGQIVCPI